MTKPAESDSTEAPPLSVQLLDTLYSILEPEVEGSSVDVSGDIPPGSLEAPEILPRAAGPQSVMDSIKAILWREDVERRFSGYEGREMELRRPEGMRHWE